MVAAAVVIIVYSSTRCVLRIWHSCCVWSSVLIQDSPVYHRPHRPDHPLPPPHHHQHPPRLRRHRLTRRRHAYRPRSSRCPRSITRSTLNGQTTRWILTCTTRAKVMMTRISTPLRRSTGITAIPSSIKVSGDESRRPPGSVGGCSLPSSWSH